MANKLNSIFEACTFQDLTGQRIRRAIQHLQHVEDMLIDISPTHTAPASADRVSVSPDLVQDDVDRVFRMAAEQAAAASGGAAGPGLAQDDVDRMFG